MRIPSIPPRTRWALLLVSLVTAAGCVTYASRSRETAGSPVPERRVSKLVAAPAISCPKPKGHAAEASRVEGNPRARAGAQRGLAFVGREATAWQATHKCYGCHVQAVTLEALSVGHHNQYDISKADLAAMLRGVIELDGGMRSATSAGSTDTAREFGGAALARYDAHVAGDARDDLMRVAAVLTEYQAPDGSLRTGHVSPPVDVGPMQSTTQGLQTWRQAYERTADERWLAPMRKAEAYLQTRAMKLSDEPDAPVVDLNYAIIGLTSAGAQGNEAALRGIGDRLRRMQRADGGWGFTATDASNAFATGQTLYALRMLGASDQDAAIARGTAWLLEHQAADGGWSHQGRGKAEAMWAVLGLVSVDVLSVKVSGVEDGQHVEGRVRVRAEAADNAGSGVERVEVAVDDVTVHRACGAAAELALDGASLEPGPHLVDVTAINARGQASRRRVEVYAGAYYLAHVSSRFDDGGTQFFLRDVAPRATRGDVTLTIFATRDEGGRSVRGAEVHRATQPSKEGPLSFFWNGSGADPNAASASRGRFVAELSFVDAGKKVVQTVEIPFVHATIEAQRAAFGDVEGALDLENGKPAANTRVELVDERGRVVQSTTTTDAGNYRFQNVDKGRYKVRVGKQGFRAAEADVAAAPAAAARPAKMQLQAQ